MTCNVFCDNARNIRLKKLHGHIFCHLDNIKAFRALQSYSGFSATTLFSFQLHGVGKVTVFVGVKWCLK